eukprot:TRINITY_DN3811_c0_g1_i1.p1 TRINITY_DN3811_c0_g1~~TRINITY_DN3811_c0_g1_i1.p1  ORF type:complete len:856 (+),score=211.32 TRINITY_DN3811_c0_g1_i1:61-2628(+)
MDEKNDRTRGGRTDFDSLLTESDKLVTHIRADNIPHINRSLGQLDEFTKRLARSTQKDVQGQIFFAERGVDVEKQRHILRKIDLSHFEPIETVPELDVERFLEHNFQMIFDTAIEECNRMSADSFRNLHVRKLEDDWQSAKRAILAAGTLSLSQPDSAMLAPATPSRGARAPLEPTVAAVPLSNRDSLYAVSVQRINASMRDRTPMPVVSTFKERCEQVNQAESNRNKNWDEAKECWELLRCMVDEKDVAYGEFKGNEQLQQRQFQDDYLNKASRLQQRLIQGAIRYYEQQYKEYIKFTIRQNAQKAARGGTPGWVHDVKAYLNVIRPNIPEGYNFQGFPLWATVFYCFRCGELLEAARLLQQAGQEEFAFCLQHMQNFPFQSLPENYWDTLTRKYNAEVYNISTDPYQLMMYHMVIRCRRGQIPGQKTAFQMLVGTTEDFFWYKLRMLWLAQDTAPRWLGESKDRSETVIPLSQLQDNFRDLGPQHFGTDGRTPMRYVTALFITLQFEEAVKYLQNTAFRLEGMHFAIALDYYGLLRRADPNTPASEPSLDLVELLSKHACSLVATDPVKALHYLLYPILVVIHSPATALDQRTLHSAYLEIKNLLLLSQDYERLIGSQPGNPPRQGVLFEYLNEDDARSLAHLAADEAHAAGKNHDAVTLYLLAQDYHRVAMLLINQLGQVVSRTTSNAERQDVLLQSQRFLAQCNRELVPSLLHILDILQRMCRFFDLYHQGPAGFDQAVMEADSMQIVPMRTDGPDRERAMAAFRGLDDNIQRNLPDLVLALMRIYHHKFQVAKNQFDAENVSARSREAARKEVLDQLRRKAQLLVDFIAMTLYAGPEIINNVLHLFSAMS